MKLTKERVRQILSQRFAEGFLRLSQIPKPDTLKDMQKAARRIAKAIEAKERIALVGDYDVDGVVSTALMKEFFDYLDYPLTTIIPNRFRHGYGISPAVIEELGDVDLIVTVDNGISAIEAAEHCRQKGIDLIITDHHTPPEVLPHAYAIVNPKQDSCDFVHKEICGAQVAWFLIAQLKKELGLDLDMRRFLDLLAIAIIADVMPLRHINRPLVQAGLQMFERSERPAVQFLRSVLKKNSFASDDIGFGIAPVLNSAGRMEDAKVALDFLMAKDFFEASVYYARLLAFNTQRKQEEKRVFEESLRYVDESPIILSAGEDWNEGVVGIVASRLVDRFKKPALVLTKKGDLYKGSGRSLGEVDLYGLLSQSEDLLERFGGHKKAAGLAVEAKNLDSLRNRLSELAKKIPKEHFIADEDVLGELEFDQVDWELIDILDAFAPYGESNPVPRFLAKDVQIVEKRMVGEHKDHLLMTLRQKDRTFKAIWFRCEKEPEKDRIDIVYQPIKNIYNNSVYIQLFINKIA